MIKRLGGALFFVIILVAIVATFISFGLAQSDSDGYAVELLGWSASDEGVDPPGGEKDVAWCEGSLQDTDGDGLNDNFDFAIYNGYPGYECQITLTIGNAGEKQFDIVGIDIQAVGTSDVTVVIYAPSAPAAPGDPWATLGPGDTEDVIFTVYIGEGAAPSTTYSIAGSIDVEGNI